GLAFLAQPEGGPAVFQRSETGLDPRGQLIEPDGVVWIAQQLVQGDESVGLPDQLPLQVAHGPLAGEDPRVHRARKSIYVLGGYALQPTSLSGVDESKVDLEGRAVDP